MTEHLTTLGIQIVPKSKNLDTYQLVDAAIEVISRSGITYQITPFETVMEGPYPQLMEIAEQAQKAVLDAGADECLVYYRIHYRKDADVTFAEKRLDR
ncbi:thiamine-binding protein [Marinoscillum furvescens]|uniref:Uncharacterized protein YqgV (UPF0045/DUF77 family) n=1 Tax=Marinoscillum furvescens DSM 4134 TaxID=1122208 RepID=A0A3D9L8N3_MARFU|nr:thiamine-binding protein [Marinoscillum furvescens]REE02200.1 uncharacterized protein YqgV (UPF0045/DUF77 family) [Marinoscillum furvescens DSM 4134]